MSCSLALRYVNSTHVTLCYVLSPSSLQLSLGLSPLLQSLSNYIFVGGNEDDVPKYVPLLIDQEYITDSFIGTYQSCRHIRKRLEV